MTADGHLVSAPVYVVAHFAITDPAEYRIYADGFLPTLDGYEARVVAVDDDVTVLEGERPDGRTVILEFASEDECLRWWNSDEYQAIIGHRHADTEAFSISIVHGMPPR